jgi:hypothetical protein
MIKKMSKKIILIIITLAMVLLLRGFIASAQPQRGSSRPGLLALHYHPAPLTIPPQVPPWFPHGFPHMWSSDDVIKTLNENGLEVKKTRKNLDVIHGPQSTRVKEVIEVSMLFEGKELEGYIFSFELKDNLENISKYYRELNNKGDHYTWSFVNGNILLILPGTITEEEARRYENVLRSIKLK